MTIAGQAFRTVTPLFMLAAPVAGQPVDGNAGAWSRWNVPQAVQDVKILPVCTGPYQISSGDLNGDGQPDLVIPCRGTLLSPKLARPANDQLTVYLHPGKAGGQWERKDFSVGFGPYHSTIGDLDGDGLPDLVVPNYQANDGRDLAILYGDENRKKTLFAPTTFLSFDDSDLVNEYGLDAQGEPRYPTPGLTSAVIADVNGDGRPDIVTVSYQSNKFYVLLNEGKRKFRTLRYPHQAPPYDQMLGGPRDVATADFDRDGILDLAFSMYESNLIEVWRGDGKGGFAPWRRNPSFGRIPYHLKAGDVDGDGRADIVVGNRSTSDNVVLLRNGPDRFAYEGSFMPQTAKNAEVTADEIRDVMLADIDKDGRLDLIAAARESGKLIFWRGTGERGFNRAFTDRRVAEFPRKGPRGIAMLPDAVAVIFYDSSEVGILPLPPKK